MTTVTSEIDAQRAAQIADRLRGIATAAEPALESAELVFLDKTADFLDDAAGVERGERVMQSSATAASRRRNHE